MSASNEWELSKENILPITSGRKAGVFRAALTTHPEDQLLQKQRAFEQKLRAYDGDDPLSIWCDYIKWVEQNYVKGGKEGNLGKLVQQCLYLLKDEERYKDDDRFVDIWLKFAKMSQKPIEVYRNMHELGIGSHSARFYVAWAWEKEQLGNVKQADDILLEGIQRMAQPVEQLEAAHTMLEARLVQMFAAEADKSAQVESEGRSHFAFLDTQEKKRAPVNRVGPSVLPPTRERLLVGCAQPQPKKAQHQKVPFKVFSEENILPSGTLDGSTRAYMLNAGGPKENEKKAGKWTKVKVQSHIPKPKAPEFSVHVDDTPQPASVRKGSTPERVLTQWKKPVNPPVALFEPPNPMVKPAYDKMKVYGGIEEYSFEEIRAAIWFAKQKEIEEEKKRQKEEQEKQAMKEQLEFLQKRVFELEKKVKADSLDMQPTKLPAVTCNADDGLQSQSTIFRSIFDNLHNTTTISVSAENNTLPFNMSKDTGTDSIGTQLSHIELKDSAKRLDLEEAFGENIPEKHSVLAVYHDPTETVSKDHVLPFEILEDATPKQVSNDKDNLFLDEDVENIPPTGYIQMQEKRELCGVLQPSKDIFFIPLEEQLKEQEEEEDDEVLAEPLPASDDFTMVPPMNTEQFALAARFVSTPCEKAALAPFQEEKSEYVLEEMMEPFEGCRVLINSLQQCLEVSKCPRAQQLITNTIEKVLGIVSSQTRDTDLKIASDYLQTCLHISKGTEIYPLICRLVSLLETCIKKLKVSTRQVNPSSISCMSHQSGYLSTIMENSREGSNKSSSSSSLSSASRIKNFSSIQRSSLMDSGMRNHPSATTKSVIKSPVTDNAGISKQNSEGFTDGEPMKTYCLEFDPFSKEVTDGLLDYMNPPIIERENFYDYSHSSKVIKVGNELQLGEVTYYIENQFASGAYAKIYSANIIVEDVLEVTRSLQQERLAIKVCKDTNAWEFYICSELKQRLAELSRPPDVADSVMNVMSAGKLKNSMVLVSKLSECGTLLDVVNAYKLRSTSIPECIALYFTLELLLIVSCMHECSILHCDIKPDNILINRINTDTLLDNIANQKTNCLELIDFGRAIDLSLFQPGIVFNTTVKTASFQCSEMKEGRPWVYQIDWFGVVGCIHVLLFSHYMSVQKNNIGEYEPTLKFKRYWQLDIWQPLFRTFLNMPSCYSQPDVKPFIRDISDVLQKQSRNFLLQMRELSSILPTKH